MTNGEIETIRNIIARLKAENLGCSHGESAQARVDELNTYVTGDPRTGSHRLEVASRLYLDTWVIPSLEMLLPGDGRDVDLARRMSR